MKDVEIGTFGETKVYMKLDELFSIANKEAKDFADQVCRDNSRLQYELDLAIEALKFYAERKHITTKNTFVEDGTIAKETLEEIEKC